VLSFDGAAADLDGVQLIGPDAPEDDLVEARRGVKIPLARLFNERERLK